MTGNPTRTGTGGTTGHSEPHGPTRPQGPTTSPDITGSARSRKPQSLLAATGSIAIATLISRITGFLKQLLILTLLGAGVRARSRLRTRSRT